MTLYQVIYDFFATSCGLASSSLSSYVFTIGGSSVDMGVWLSHTASVITFTLLIVVAFKFTWWLVKLVSHAFMLRR